jgi:hypothetical protein
LKHLDVRRAQRRARGRLHLLHDLGSPIRLHRRTEFPPERLFQICRLRRFQAARGARSVRF